MIPSKQNTCVDTSLLLADPGRHVSTHVFVCWVGADISDEQSAAQVTMHNNFDTSKEGVLHNRPYFKQQCKRKRPAWTIYATLENNEIGATSLTRLSLHT